MEDDETFSVTLGAITGTTSDVGTGSTAVATIENDDSAQLTIVAGQDVVTEGDQSPAGDADVRGGEPLFDGENVIGVTTSGGYGHTVNKSLAFAFVDPVFAIPGSAFEVEILAERHRATVLAEPAYDPKNLRLRS